MVYPKAARFTPLYIIILFSLYWFQSSNIHVIFQQMSIGKIILKLLRSYKVRMSTDKMSNRQNVEQTICRQTKSRTDKMSTIFFFVFFSQNFSMPKNNVAGNSGMPLSANLLKLESSILPRAKRASSETT